MKTSLLRPGYLARLMFTGTMLWLLWGVWRPVYFSLADTLARPETAAALAALEAENFFLIEGKVQPLAEPVREWQGRFAFLHRQYKDVGVQTKEQRVVDLEYWRPALRFTWTGGSMTLPADSYGLEHAPRIKPRFWPRKWLGTTRVDDWHESSRGFRAGAAALAYGSLDETKRPRVKLLLQTPLETVTNEIGHTNRMRQGLVLAAKIMLSLFVLSLCLPPRKPRPPELGTTG